MPFIFYPLELLSPKFDSEVTDLIIDLDVLRQKVLKGTTSPSIFFQLKTFFHMVESIGSARIEGNNTTVLEYVDVKIDNTENVSEPFKEIKNMEDAMSYVDGDIRFVKIDKRFISDLHKMIVEGLNPNKEGDPTP